MFGAKGKQYLSFVLKGGNYCFFYVQERWTVVFCVKKKLTCQTEETIAIFVKLWQLLSFVMMRCWYVIPNISPSYYEWAYFLTVQDPCRLLTHDPLMSVDGLVSAHELIYICCLI